MPTNIRLGWKGIELANTLAYYDAASITAVKKFYSTDSYKTFGSKFNHSFGKLDRSIVALYFYYCTKTVWLTKRIGSKVRIHNSPFPSLLMNGSNKLECFSLTSVSSLL